MRSSIFFLSGFVFFLTLAEVILQILPVNSGLRKMPTSESNPSFRFVPNQEYTYSYGWALDNPRRGKINNDGYNNSKNMQDHAKVLVTGDSYIESLMLGYSDTVQGKLDAVLDGGVYAAASSGNGLADSLQVLNQYVPKIHPKNVVIFVEAQDVKTLLDVATRGHSYFRNIHDQIVVDHTAYQESSVKQLLMHSAFIRYVFYNIKFPDWFSAKVSKFHGGKNVQLASSNERVTRDRCAEYYFSEVRKLSDKFGFRTIFLVDPDREKIYKNSDRDLGWGVGDRAWILKNIKKNNFTLVDLQPVFAEDWQKRRQQFDFQPIDGHWNKVGHGLAANELLKLIPAVQ